jgi:two-component system, NarL family, nitrate/nitrite sensor histidine kinase NarX
MIRLTHRRRKPDKQQSLAAETRLHKPDNPPVYVDSTDTNWSIASLTTLYKLSNTINAARTQQELLSDFIDVLSRNIGVDASLVRLLTDDGWMEIVSSFGIDKDRLKKYHKTPIDGSMFSRSNEIVSKSFEPFLRKMVNDDSLTIFAIPVRYNVRTHGVINLYSRNNEQLPAETHRLWITAGEHLGQALDKFFEDAEQKQRLIQNERNIIANELHDSLAQTLASLRFQVRVLDQALQPSGEFSTINSIEQVEHGLDEAYTDLRELIAHCRIPVAKQGLIPSIKRVVEKFREETDIHILLQCECRKPDIPANMEMNVYRIVQESLTNIRKHADAHIVRVLLQCDDDGNYLILIENDGKGFDKKAIQSEAGKHLGLTIMKERARYLGGKLKIDSEPDEGTRIELRFKYLPEQNIGDNISLN